MTTNVTWTSCGNPIGEPFRVNITTGDSNSNQFWVGDPPPWGTGTGNESWIPMVPSSDPNPPPPPFMPTITFPSIEEETDEDGKRVIKSPPPSLEVILVEIAKILREGGDILEVREIFERHKLKLVDHDGEVVFDPKDVDNLEDKGL